MYIAFPNIEIADSWTWQFKGAICRGARY